MRCPACQAELTAEPKYCSECGHNLKSKASNASPGSDSAASGKGALAGGADESALKPPSGFSRTLSTDLVAKQIELRTLAKLNTLVQSQTYQPGEIMIRKGEIKRDLFFLTEGLVEISRQEGNADVVLNEIEPPYILGEIGFLFGMPRTATAVAKTESKAFVLKHKDLKDLIKDLPEWLCPLLTSLASGIKSLHHKSKKLETENQGK